MRAIRGIINMLIDTHVHLDAISNARQAIASAQAAGIRAMVAVGMDLRSNNTILNLAGQFPEIVYPAVGYHPWMIRDDEVEETLLFIKKHIKHCVALGEVGLDYKVKVKKPLQREVLTSILEIALNMGKPVIVHSRFSHERTYKMVSKAGIEKAVFHWYSGPLDILDRILDDGFFVSATPALAYSPPHQAAITKAPLGQILIETDAPVAYQGKVSEPAHLVDTLRELSRLKQLSMRELSIITTENASTFFGI